MHGRLHRNFQASSAGRQLPFFVTGPMNWIPTPAASILNPEISKLCDGTTKAVAAGVVDSGFTKGLRQSLQLTFYSDGGGYFPTQRKAVATDFLAYSPEANAAQASPDIVIPPFTYSAIVGGFALSSLAAGTPASAVGSGATPSASASGTGTSFGSTVDFTVVYGLNGGPTWTLTHFKGPQGGSGSLVNLSRQVVDTLTVTFVPACQDAADVQPVVSSYWDTLPPCNASSFANAAATAQGFNALQLRRGTHPPERLRSSSAAIPQWERRRRGKRGSAPSRVRGNLTQSCRSSSCPKPPPGFRLQSEGGRGLAGDATPAASLRSNVVALPGARIRRRAVPAQGLGQARAISLQSAIPPRSTVTRSNWAMLVTRSSSCKEPSSVTVTSVTDFGPASPMSRPCGIPGITTVAACSAMERL